MNSPSSGAKGARSSQAWATPAEKKLSSTSSALGSTFSPLGSVGNLAAVDLDQITQVVKRGFKQIQYRPDLVDGCLAGTGLIMDG
ncbi:hypothetical protein OG520_35990 [Streptomyces sp. NBC_00984]|uniref:hypothetical protein n=1 Tax=Streptomyces sp. NBC_00984 TaxID=2903700 RepID=UPI00386AF92D|nr:hypothetical protein OG520_35990 [Streptomyces sp. NBC_00984]